MSKKALFLLFAAMSIFFASCDDEATTEVDFTRSFIKFFGQGLDDQAVDLVEKPEGGFLMLITQETNALDKDLLVISTDAEGNELWRTVLGSDGLDQATSLTLDPSTGDIYVTGGLRVGPNPETPNDDASAFIAKLSSEGAEVWTQEFAPGSLNVDVSRLFYITAVDLVIEEKTEGTDLFLLLRMKTQEDLDTDDTDEEVVSSRFYDLRLNPSDGQISPRNASLLGTTRGEPGANPKRLIQHPVFGPIICYNYPILLGSEARNVGFAATSQNSGAAINKGEDDDDEIINDAVIVGNRIFFVGETTEGISSVPYLGTVSMNGQGPSDFGFSENVSEGLSSIDIPILGSQSAKSIAVLEGGNAFAVLTTGDVPGIGETTESDFIVRRINSNGVDEWSPPFEFGGDFQDTGAKVIETADGGVAFIGTFGVENTDLIALIKLNSDGELKNY